MPTLLVVRTDERLVSEEVDCDIAAKTGDPTPRGLKVHLDRPGHRHSNEGLMPTGYRR
jgi:hypothetical protein